MNEITVDLYDLKTKFWNDLSENTDERDVPQGELKEMILEQRRFLEMLLDYAEWSGQGEESDT